MDETTKTLEAMQMYQDEIKEVIKRGEALLRLTKNPDFRAVILEDFCLNASAAYVQESTNPRLSEGARADALALAQASGHLKRFLDVRYQQYHAALNELEGVQESVDELRGSQNNITPIRDPNEVF